MADSSPASGAPGRHAFIPFTVATGTAATGTGAPVLATAPDRTPPVLQQALPTPNGGQQNPRPTASQPTMFSINNLIGLSPVLPEVARIASRVPDRDAGKWYVGMGFSLLEKRLPLQAAEYFRMGLPLEEKALGADHPDMGSLHNLMGALLYKLGEHA